LFGQADVRIVKVAGQLTGGQMGSQASFRASYLCCVLALAAAVAVGQGRDPGEIVIGEYVALSGATSTFGISTRNGIDLAVDAVNRAGGVLGKRVRIIVEDDQGRPQEAQRVVAKLINEDKVVAILGGVASSISLAAAPIAQQRQVPMISPSSTNPRVTRVGDYIFRVCFIDPFQGFAMAQFATTTLQSKNAAILRNIKSDYSIELADAFSETFKRMGGSVSLDETYSTGDNDFSAQLTRIKSTNPDVVFVPGSYTEAALIATQAKRSGITAPLLGGDGWDSPRLIVAGGDSLNGSYYSNHYAVDDPGPENQNLVAKYRERYQQDPDALSALAFDSANLLFDAIRRANSTDPSRIRDALAQTTDFMGVVGRISLDKDRNAVRPAVVLQVKDGKVIYARTVAPR
jgi:branched-chain amino acid transport system substrate-binding protein